VIKSRTGRCVVFDLDDTLYDEIDYVRSGFRAVAIAVRQRYNADCEALLQERLETRLLSDAFQHAALDLNLPADAPAFMRETYRAHEPSIRLRAGLGNLLAGLRSRDGVLGCITDGRGLTQRAKLRALGMQATFDVVLVSEETGHAKPDPHNFEEMMRQVQASRFCYVADDPMKDFIAPNALNWQTIGVHAPKSIHDVPQSKWPANGRPERWVDASQLPSAFVDDESAAGEGSRWLRRT
jgi:putative hydrolase of the HAD superfamily